MPRCYIVKKQQPPAMPAYRNRTTVVTATAGTHQQQHQHQQHQTTVRPVLMVGNGKPLKEPNEQGAARGLRTATGGGGCSALGNVIVKNGGGNEPTGGSLVLLPNSVSVISGGPVETVKHEVESVGFTLASVGGNGSGSGGGGGGASGSAGIVQRKDDSSGPVSPTEGCVAPIYYTNISENKSVALRGAYGTTEENQPFTMRKRTKVHENVAQTVPHHLGPIWSGPGLAPAWPRLGPGLAPAWPPTERR
uniref:Uncharacterized protein n=1 Tax=Anopheles farauti TaxID=69004 RepID=A0A182QRF3_9DIPT